MFVFPLLAIVIGCIIFVVAFLGCCGAITENKCMIFSVSIILSTFDSNPMFNFMTFLVFNNSADDFVDWNWDRSNCIREKRFIGCGCRTKPLRNTEQYQTRWIINCTLDEAAGWSEFFIQSYHHIINSESLFWLKFNYLVQMLWRQQSKWLVRCVQFLANVMLSSSR